MRKQMRALNKTTSRRKHGKRGIILCFLHFPRENFFKNFSMAILVFKTDVENMYHIRKLYALFKTIQGIIKWNVDTEDVDKILRVETLNVSPQKIEMTLQSAGY